jgi:bacillithiol biosynthesis deacetylase BshB1
MLSSPDRLHVLAIAAHPDDVELCAGGTVAKLSAQGYRVGIADLTRGELGSRGTPELRHQEAARAAEILGVDVRVNLGIPDGGIENTPEHRRRLIEVVRQYRPHIVLTNPAECRHPDHGNAARLTVDALFYAGLPKLETKDADGRPQEPWRPPHVLHYMQSIPFEPTFIVDVSEFWDQRMQAMLAFGSQFHQAGNPDGGNEPQTFVSNPDFLEWVTAQARAYGHRIGAQYGEPFRYRHGPVGVDDLMTVLSRSRRFV